MKLRHIILPLCVVALPIAWLHAADAISQPAAREKTLADLEKIGVAATAKPQAEPVKDPFNPPAADLREAAAPGREGDVGRHTEEELPTLLIAKIQPTGSMTLGGEPYLLFTERRQKNGDKLTVELDGVEYVVEIVSIGTNRFRIRYNGKEAERTIK
jgi:hypothetical protein